MPRLALCAHRGIPSMGVYAPIHLYASLHVPIALVPVYTHSFSPSFCRNHKASCTPPEQGAALPLGIVFWLPNFRTIPRTISFSLSGRRAHSLSMVAAGRRA